MNPKVSVVIPCYNYGRYLTDAVESVVNQTYQDFEIIIVNDGSTDNTKLVAESLIESYKNYNIVLLNQTNSGQPAITRNHGIAESKGKYILCLDADDKIAPTMIEECVKVLENDASVAIAYTDRMDFDGIDKVVQAGDYNFEKLKYENHISYCALYRREVWEQVGGYRTNVKGCEDWDFWVAAGIKSYFGKKIPKPLFQYRRHDTGVFQSVQGRLHESQAQIILNNTEAYSSEEIKNAKQILDAIAEWKSQTKSKVSVIIPTYNRPEQLAKAIDSVLMQTFRDFEIIVINDGGIDVKNLIDDLNIEKNIIYLHHAINRGLPAARNTGIRIARGKYIAYLDDDDTFYPEHLKTLVDFLETSDSKIAYTDAYRAIYKTVNGNNVLTRKEIFASQDFDNARLLVENYIPVICVMHEKSCFEDAGLFDETLTSHEDWELWIRMSKKFSFGHIPKITCEFSWLEDDVRESHRRSEFLSTLLKIYDKYNEAEKNPGLLIARENKLIKALHWAYDHIKGLETEKVDFQKKVDQRDSSIDELNEKIKVLKERIDKSNHSIQMLNAKLAAIQDNLSWQLLNRYVFAFWDKWIIPFGSKRRAVLEKFFRKKILPSGLQPKYSDATNITIESAQTKKRIIKKSKNISAVKRFIIYSSSQGNYFFTEIRDLIAEGLKELGYRVETKNETSWSSEEDAWHIVVAPHEFFYLGAVANSDIEVLPENLILVNTEQPSTKWALLAENYFSVARFIWDINYNSAKEISKNGLKSKFFPLGFASGSYLFKEINQLPENYATCFLDKHTKNNSFYNKAFRSRPIDISFVGALTHRRDEFFARTAEVISKYKSYIHLSDGLAAPVIPGVTSHMNTETVLGIMQRSKITLNIHHGSDEYFEWHRIVLLGIAQRTLVISETTISTPFFQNGIHYIEAKLKDIPERIEYYLSDPKGIIEAEKIVEKGYKKFTEECKLVDSLRTLIAELGIKI